jgi:BMFP domain-containing protein YqiC
MNKVTIGAGICFGAVIAIAVISRFAITNKIIENAAKDTGIPKEEVKKQFKDLFRKLENSMNGKSREDIYTAFSDACKKFNDAK